MWGAIFCSQLTFSAVHATAAVVTTRQGLLRVWHTKEHYRAPAPALRSNRCLRLWNPMPHTEPLFMASPWAAVQHFMALPLQHRHLHQRAAVHGITMGGSAALPALANAAWAFATASCCSWHHHGGSATLHSRANAASAFATVSMHNCLPKEHLCLQ